MLGKTLVLAAKTKRGREKIKKYGAIWVVEDQRDHVPCLGAAGLMIRSVQDSSKRWIKMFDDKDFIILKQTDK